MDSRQLLVLAINRLPGTKGWKKHRLLLECRDMSDFQESAKQYLSGLRMARRTETVNVQRIISEAEVEIGCLEHWGIQYSVLGNSDYPPALAMISDPPFVLYRRGLVDFNGKPPIAIVGTRRPSGDGLREAYKLGLEFALAAYPVVSGLAFGIDKAAHEGALDGGGRTWAVLAGGLDRPSPFSHRSLATRILDKGGALLGEIPPGGFPLKYAFPRRNRILSGLCRGCITVQAPRKSGALTTAEFALEQDRDLYVGSSGITGPYSEGTRNLEEQGAPVVRSAGDVLADWGRFTDVRRVEAVGAPCSGADMAGLMRKELNGCLYRHYGGWFESRGA
ncbi:MAG: DNA protecting protein DprA [Spirochaeta sp. LUC14_002_19_P3]|nr:MAG: DNA protecting protein DprA [Spirochaeta sp. LUC14_002_19_P3]